MFALMTGTDPGRLQTALHTLFERAVRNSRIATEVQRARREFFGPAEAPAATSGDPAAAEWMREQRLMEWFLLERESDALGGAPAETMPLQGDEGDLADSMVGVFRLTATGDQVLAHDLQDEAAEPLELIVTGADLQPGDLLVGRFFPGAVGGWVPFVPPKVGALMISSFEPPEVP